MMILDSGLRPGSAKKQARETNLVARTEKWGFHMYADSLDKIVRSYISQLVSEPLRYKNELFLPKNIHVSPLLYRTTDCPTGCSGCCPRFSLDYLPTEDLPDIPLVERSVLGKKVVSYLPGNSKEYHCDFVAEGGRCAVHPNRPFSCDFELIRFKNIVKQNKVLIGTFPFGRAWALKRVDGERGALCKMTPCHLSSKDEVLRKLNRLKGWIDYLEIPTRIDDIIYNVINGSMTQPYIITQVDNHQGFLRNDSPTN